jgi:hypothetical protein
LTRQWKMLWSKSTTLSWRTEILVYIKYKGIYITTNLKPMSINWCLLHIKHSFCVFLSLRGNTIWPWYHFHRPCMYRQNIFVLNWKASNSFQEELAKYLITSQDV